VDDTFWHELTHAILYDMGHDLSSNERFVSAFANRLCDAVNSAKL
jgi:predicted heme/steroid binding protein